MEILKLENICKSYRMGEVIEPLKNLFLTVASGDFIAIEGPSGIGKSTLLYILGTLLQSDSGRYIFDGCDVGELSDNEKSELRARKIGFIFQDSVLVQSLSLKENLILASRITRKEKPDLERIQEFLTLFGLKDRADYLPYQLSGGQKRRAMAARCLMQSPQLILADEPTNDLDDSWSEVIVEQLQAAARSGAGVVMVSHNAGWSRSANRRYILEKGQLSEV